MSADWIFHSGRIFDGQQLHSTATAVAVTGNRITAVGTDEEILAGAGSATAVDLAGRLLTPGFTDAHVHAAIGGLERLNCDISQLSGRDAVLAAIRNYAAGSDKPWITGGGWHGPDFPGGCPTKELLDAVVADRPVYLVNADHHGAWVNSKALELAGVDEHTPDPVDGRIERHADGSPAGTLHEGAMDLVNRILPPATAEDFRESLLESQRYLHSLGVTGWQEAILGNYAGYGDAAAAYRSLSAEGLLTGRATGALWVPRTTTAANIDALIADFQARRRLNADAGFATVSAKIMVDGIAENFTAAMVDPYLRPCRCEQTAAGIRHDEQAGSDGGGDNGGGESDNGRGLMYLPQDVLDKLSAALDAAGFDLHMHVIGDRAVRNGLDAVEHARRENGTSGGRHHMAHIQIIQPQDVPRFAALDVTANAQALWACNDDQMIELTVPFLGEERAGWQYPFGSLLGAGTRLAMGSDWPVSTPDPWQAIHVAVNRSHPDFPDAPPLIPGEAVDLRTALAAYTSGSAWLNRLDDGGAIASGRLADVVVLNTNPFDLDPAELHTVRANVTMVDGQPVHSGDRQEARI